MWIAYSDDGLGGTASEPLAVKRMFMIPIPVPVPLSNKTRGLRFSHTTLSRLTPNKG
jgi:hypothetical protein